MCCCYAVVREKEEWDAYVEGALMHEVYHTWFYHSLNREGEPIMFVYREENFYIALPLVKRKIPDSSFFDMTSVYGYTGPLANTDMRNITVKSASRFKVAFAAFMDQENAICAFSRLHPFLYQHYLLEMPGGIRKNGSTVYIDLTTDINEQRARYHKVLQKQVRKLRTRNYLIREADSNVEVELFTRMYNDNMDRVHASAAYYFDEKYFNGLLQDRRSDNRLLLIYDGPVLICGALVMISAGVIRNHLSATALSYIRESPSKLLTDEISLMGRAIGVPLFHLGGGVGGRNDTLFMFKRHFSDLYMDDHIWCYIHNAGIYRDIAVRYGGGTDPDSGFFPVYRQQVKAE